MTFYLWEGVTGSGVWWVMGWPSTSVVVVVDVGGGMRAGPPYLLPLPTYHYRPALPCRATPALPLPPRRHLPPFYACLYRLYTPLPACYYTAHTCRTTPPCLHHRVIGVLMLPDVVRWYVLSMLSYVCHYYYTTTYTYAYICRTLSMSHGVWNAVAWPDVWQMTVTWRQRIYRNTFCHYYYAYTMSSYAFYTT